MLLSNCLTLAQDKRSNEMLLNCLGRGLLKWVITALTIHYLYCQQFFVLSLAKCKVKWKMLWELSGI